jgi:AcrR family transcriptional regulator
MRAASIQDLVQHMGINRQSMYDTFGDKACALLAGAGPLSRDSEP